MLPGGLGRENSDFVRSNIFGNFGVQLGDWRFGLTVSAVDGNQGLPPNTFSAAANNPFTGGQFFERLDRVSGRTAQFDATYQAGGPFTLRMSAYVNASSVADNRYDNAAYTTMIDPTVKTFREIIDTTVSGGQTQAIYDFGAFGSLTGSFLVRREEEVLTGQIRGRAAGRNGERHWGRKWNRQRSRNRPRRLDPAGRPLRLAFARPG
ncbi:hypothetical protein ACRAWG_16465 [Methylobacterium sp. P31]